MKSLWITSLLCALIPYTTFSQTSKKRKGPSVHAATAFNFYQSVKPYQFISERTAYYNDLILTYITKNAGTFIAEGDSLALERTLTSKMPSQIAGLGASVQVRHANGVFHEASVTKLSFFKSTHDIHYVYTDTAGYDVGRSLGYDENMMAIGIRYELGKYFGKNQNAPFRFGFSGGVEPTLYRYKRNSHTSQEYPMKANLFTVDLSLMPVASVTFSKKVGMDFKLISNVLMADFGKVIEEDPSKTVRQQAGLRNYQSPDITWAFSVLLRYTIQEAKKK